MSEFDLIRRYFTRATHHTDLSVGDDAALIAVAHGMQLAISVDMLVAGTHFFEDADPYQLGWKSLAVNLSDMAAMSAQAKWATLAIALPEVNENWLTEFSRGFFACANQFNIDLIGGDTTRGPLAINVQIMGEVPTGQALKRSGAKVNDDIWVSGQLGSAALGLAYLQDKIKIPPKIRLTCLNALHMPMPRQALGLGLRGIATSCVDISDGLLADLGHILKASSCGATLNLEEMPCIEYLKAHLTDKNMQKLVLTGGDDYELCFTAPASSREQIVALSRQVDLPITRIGKIHTDAGLYVYHQGDSITLLKQGFDHFA